MPQLVCDQIAEAMTNIKDSYYRLIFVVGQSCSGKTTALQQVRDAKNAPLLNVSLELSRRLLELTERQRILQLPKLLDEIVVETGREEVILDNNEILFDIQLKQDPLRLLQGLSRSRTVVASWNGRTNSESLFYATSDHPEFRQYPLQDMMLVVLEDSNKPCYP